MLYNTSRREKPPWSLEKFTHACKAQGHDLPAHALIAFFIQAQPYVVRGECSIEHIARCFDSTKGAIASLCEAIATYKKTD